MEIKRTIIKELYSDLFDKKISILIGARQVGKTFLLHKIESEAKRLGKSAAFFDLEQPAVLRLFNAKNEDIVKLLTTSGDVIFIDEFHYIENASHIFKAIYDSGAPVKIFASGSSSLEIHKHLKESLVGRKIIHRIFPCTKEELLESNLSINHCLVYGGLPGLVHERSDNEKKVLLQDVLKSYIMKDIKGLVKEENVRAFNHLLYLLAQTQANLISVASFSREVGLTARTIESHLEIMQQMYVLHPIYSYSTNLGNELKKSRKFFFYDIGVRNVLLKDFRMPEERPDGGAIIEAFTFLEFMPKITPDVEIRFWRTKAGEEVDFIWIKDRRPYPIEVKSQDCAGNIPSGMVSFLRRYPQTEKAFILHGGEASEIMFGKTMVGFRPWIDAAHIPDEL